MNSIPQIGAYWQGQGGIYAGIICDTETKKQWHLILATEPSSMASKVWGNYGHRINGDFSFTDGKLNTQLILAAEKENKICTSVDGLSIEDHQDYYLPAQKELNLIYINLQDHCEKTWHWSSTQYSGGRAWYQHFAAGTQDVDSKYNALAVRAVRRIYIEELVV